MGERGRDGWTVRTADGQVREYTAVLVANGHLTDPYVPAMAADFTGRSDALARLHQRRRHRG